MFLPTHARFARLNARAQQPRIDSPIRTRQPVTVLAEGGRIAGLGQYSPPSYFDATWQSVFVAGCEAIGANPYDVAGLLMNESGFNPSAVNSISCVGLNQMCPGSQNFTSDYTVSQYTALTVSEQLPYVFEFWQNWLSQYGLLTISARDLYWLNFLPATYVPNSPDSYVIVDQNGVNSQYYSQNQGLDVGGTGQITAGDLYQAILNTESNYPNTYLYLAEMITLAGGPLAYLPWPYFAAASAAAGFVGFYAWKQWGGGRGKKLPAWVPSWA